MPVVLLSASEGVRKHTSIARHAYVLDDFRLAAFASKLLYMFRLLLR
jgi:hypothetical protein